jgi:hypothetical protein
VRVRVCVCVCVRGRDHGPDFSWHSLRPWARRVAPWFGHAGRHARVCDLYPRTLGEGLLERPPELAQLAHVAGYPWTLVCLGNFVVVYEPVETEGERQQLNAEIRGHREQGGGVAQVVEG